MEYDLVFEGGGAKGMVFVGAMAAFEAAGYRIGRLMGTSAGAITATFLAAGYDSAEMQAVLSEEVDGQPAFATFLGKPEFDPTAVKTSALRDFFTKLDLPLVPEAIEEKVDDWIINALATHPRYAHLLSFIEYGGWYSADNFLAWIREKLDSGELNGQPRHFSQMTLAQFYQATKKHLTLVAADTSANRLLVLNHLTAPDCPVVYAVRMSMSIPLLWQEVVWQSDWGLYRGRDISGHTIVDGGVLSNFPIELFISSDSHITSLMGEKTTNRVIGMLIDENAKVVTLPTALAEAETPIEPGGVQWMNLATVQRIKRLVDTMTSAHDKMVLDAFDKYVVRCPARGFGTTEFDMPPEKQTALIAAGHQTMEGYLSTSLPRPGTLSGGFDPEQKAREEALSEKVASKILALDF